MGLGPFSSDSKSSQETVNVGGQGQYNKKSSVAQGGSVLLSKGANVGGYNLKAKGNVTVTNTGATKQDFKDLIGQITAATPAAIERATPAPLSPAPAAAATTDTDAIKKYLIIGLLLAAGLAVGFIARALLKK